MTGDSSSATTGPGRVESLARELRAVVAVLVVGSLMVVLDTTILSVAVGELSRQFRAPLPAVQWAVTGYTLALVTSIPVTAWAVGRWGATRVYLAAVSLFLVGSGLAGVAWTLESLVAFRVLQGLGGGLLTPVAMTIVLRNAPPPQRGRAMALLGLPVLIGAAIGPTLGGWLLDAASWRWMFWVNLPLGMLTIALGRRILPADAPASGPALDRVGLLLLSPGLAALLYGLTRVGDGVSLDAVGAGSSLVGAAMVAAFAWRALRQADPLISIGLLRRRDLAVGAGILLCFSAAYFGSVILTPLYFQLGRGETATMSGLLLVPQAVATGVSMQVAGRLLDRVPPGRVVGAGIAMAAAGFGLFAVLLSPTTPYLALAAALVLAGLGVGATLMPTITTATRHLDHDDSPSGTTLLTIVSQVATATGAAAVSVLLAARLAAELPEVDSEPGALYELSTTRREALAQSLTDAFQATYLLPVALMGGALLVAAGFLTRRAAS
ncbi:MAG: DHA2 family efflux MFS transporter permease subunit [Phycicoccus sp.]